MPVSSTSTDADVGRGAVGALPAETGHVLDPGHDAPTGWATHDEARRTIGLLGGQRQHARARPAGPAAVAASRVADEAQLERAVIGHADLSLDDVAHRVERGQHHRDELRP